MFHNVWQYLSQFTPMIPLCQLLSSISYITASMTVLDNTDIIKASLALPVKCLPISSIIHRHFYHCLPLFVNVSIRRRHYPYNCSSKSAAFLNSVSPTVSFKSYFYCTGKAFPFWECILFPSERVISLKQIAIAMCQ